MIDLAPLSVQGAVVRQPLPAGLRGVFVVSWWVLADDGHLSAGRFAVALATEAELPASSSSVSARTPASQVAASWILFLGFALAFGALVAEFVVWRRALPSSRSASLLVPVGLALAAMGAVVELVLVFRDRAGGAFGSALDPSALEHAIATRPGGLSAAVLGVLGLVAVLTGSSRAPPATALVLRRFLCSWRFAATPEGAVVADAIHLARQRTAKRRGQRSASLSQTVKNGKG